jgi:hypothetical protein
LSLPKLVRALEQRMIMVVGRYSIGSLSHSDWRAAYDAYTGCSLPQVGPVTLYNIPPLKFLNEKEKKGGGGGRSDVRLQYNSHPGFVDGDMVQLFFELDKQQRKEVAENVVDDDLKEMNEENKGKEDILMESIEQLNKLCF